MRLGIFVALAVALLGGGPVQAQQWEDWRRGYERERETVSREADRPPAGRRQMNRQTWSESDFERYWEDAPWPERQGRNIVSSEGYRDRRDPYSDSMYGSRDEVNTDYRNPYRDYDDPDADGYGDSNRFNNDSDYLSPSELQYRSRFRPIFFGRERYDEREQRWDDETMGHRRFHSTVRQPVTIEHGDISRWR